LLAFFGIQITSFSHKCTKKQVPTRNHCWIHQDQSIRNQPRTPHSMSSESAFWLEFRSVHRQKNVSQNHRFHKKINIGQHLQRKSTLMGQCRVNMVHQITEFDGFWNCYHSNYSLRWQFSRTLLTHSIKCHSIHKDSSVLLNAIQSNQLSHFQYKSLIVSVCAFHPAG
jgi:hypothetical protein